MVKHSAIDPGPLSSGDVSLLRHVAAYADRYNQGDSALSPTDNAAGLRRRFNIGLPDKGRPVDQVIADLISAAEPGLVGSTRAGFLSWVIGASHEAGVAADWLTSLWGQNAGLYQTGPSAAACEGVVANWLLDLLDLPPASSVGFVTGATMAAFSCLATARSEMLARHGHDVEELGLQGAPHLTVLVGADAHVSNLVALRYLGLGKTNIVEVDANSEGVMDLPALRAAAAGVTGPAIVIAQAGQVNSGAFDDLAAVAEVARGIGAWLHVDGAFGLWARAAPNRRHLAGGAELADSWALDGHKWLQTPYDSGFAIVRHPAAARRAMAKEAGYLNNSPDDGRNPSNFVPELSRRARGFAAWAMLQALGRDGIRQMVEKHCLAARRFADRCRSIAGARVVNQVVLNQVVVDLGPHTQQVCDALNGTGRFFLRTAEWQDRTILRVSFAGHPSGEDTADELADALTSILEGPVP
ncbi:MAG TPA: pyridoxal-dependent decarboxylase [Sphingomicrobium sp.]|nr:pyridoxal-dependent decarboxylase [Sphingomicrobium sp.]